MRLVCVVIGPKVAIGVVAVNPGGIDVQLIIPNGIRFVNSPVFRIPGFPLKFPEVLCHAVAVLLSGLTIIFPDKFVLLGMEPDQSAVVTPEAAGNA